MAGVRFVGRNAQELEKAKLSVPAVTEVHSARPLVLMQESASPDASVVMGEHFVVWTAPTLVS